MKDDLGELIYDSDACDLFASDFEIKNQKHSSWRVYCYNNVYRLYNIVWDVIKNTEEFTPTGEYNSLQDALAKIETHAAAF